MSVCSASNGMGKAFRQIQLDVCLSVCHSFLQCLSVSLSACLCVNVCNAIFKTDKAFMQVHMNVHSLNVCLLFAMVLCHIQRHFS